MTEEKRPLSAVVTQKSGGGSDDEEDVRREHQYRGGPECGSEDIGVRHTPTLACTVKDASVRRGRQPDEPNRDPNNARPRTSAMNPNVGGYRFILGLYAALVAIVGVAGYLIRTFASGLGTPRSLFLAPLPLTLAGFVAYGVLIIALVLGILLALVVYISAGLDDAA